MTSSKSRNPKYILYLNALVLGGCALAYEYNLSKLGSDLMGNSMTQWAITIGSMMLFMGIGSDLQGRLKDKYLVDRFISLEILLGVVGAVAPLALLYIYGASYEYWAVAQQIFIAGIGLLIGFELPLLMRLNSQFATDLKSNVGSILRMDYIGSLIGALVWVFVLTRTTDVITGAFYLGLCNCLIAWVSIYVFRSKLRRPKWAYSFASLALVGLLVGLWQSPKWSVSMQQKLYQDPIVLQASSPFQQVIMTESRSGVLKFYINGNVQFTSFDEHIYHEQLVHPAMTLHKKPRNVLILGGGDGLALREVLKYPNLQQVVLSDLDPLITQLASTHPKLVALNKNSFGNSKLRVHTESKLSTGHFREVYLKKYKRKRVQESEEELKIEIMNVDAVGLLKRTENLFDIIIADFPDPNSPELANLYSKQFYELAMQRLTPKGIFVQQSTNTVYSRKTFQLIGQTMQSAGMAVLPYHELVPSIGDWGFWLGGRQSDYSIDFLRKSMKKASELKVATRYLTPELIQKSLIFGDPIILDSPSISTIFNNQAYATFRKEWKKYF